MSAEQVKAALAVRSRIQDAIDSGKAELVEVPVENHLHAGVYSRTILLKKGVAASGVLIQVPTQLVISGDVTMNDGTTLRRITGYHVLECGAGRMQTAYAHADTRMTMFYASKAATVDEAEDEFTNEPENLQTRRKKCPE